MSRILLVFSVFFLSSCVNLFDPLDSPSGDAQIMAAARACFDKKDYECARELYGKLTGNETARAEEAFMILDQEGLGTAALVRAVASAEGSSVGTIITKMVEEAAPGAGAAKRIRLVEAYRKLAEISNPTVRGFVQFVVALSIASELLAEQSGVQADYVFNKVDFADGGAACTVSGGGCALDADCAVATGGLAAGVATDGDDLKDPDYTTYGSAVVSAATLSAVQNAIEGAAIGLSNIGVSEGSSFQIIQQIGDIGYGPAAAPECYRAAILELGIGR